MAVTGSIVRKEYKIDLVGSRWASDLQLLVWFLLTLGALIDFELFVRMSQLLLVEFLPGPMEFGDDLGDPQEGISVV